MIDHTEKIKALGDETRLRIVRILLKAGVQLCVCEIGSITGKPQYAISRALGILRTARLVKEERDGKLVKYGIIAENDFTRKLLDSVAAIKCADVPAFSEDVKNIKKILQSRDDSGKPTNWCGCK
ncbi:MAG TPA: metalloregulator ArsR/SmtB family transcription factor [Treponemataceae bacterium]|nr:metalloregulator ArsR/SmtB family transcription factor [Treponemataceae bacterium]